MRTVEGEMEEFDSLRKLGMGQDAYRSIITGKTAWMLRASCELGALRAGASDTLVAAAARFGLELGIAFQMVDDALDFYPPEKTGKPMGGDLREGKVTPPLLLYLEALSSEERRVFSEKFAADSLSDEEIARTARAIHAGGFADKTRDLAGVHLGHAREALLLFPASEERAILEQAVDFIQHREQ
jgi:octaprenyl-diphosphate synthase